MNNTTAATLHNVSRVSQFSEITPTSLNSSNTPESQPMNNSIIFSGSNRSAPVNGTYAGGAGHSPWVSGTVSAPFVMGPPPAVNGTPVSTVVIILLGIGGVAPIIFLVLVAGIRRCIAVSKRRQHAKYVFSADAAQQEVASGAWSQADGRYFPHNKPCFSGIRLDSFTLGQSARMYDKGDYLHADKDSFTGFDAEMYNPRRKSSRSSDAESLELTVRKFFDTESNRSPVLQLRDLTIRSDTNSIFPHSIKNNKDVLSDVEKDTRLFTASNRNAKNELPSDLNKDDVPRYLKFPRSSMDALASSSSEFDSDVDLMHSQDAIFTGSTYFVNKKPPSKRSSFTDQDDFDSDISKEEYGYVIGVGRLLSRSTACYDIAALATESKNTGINCNLPVVPNFETTGSDNCLNKSPLIDIKVLQAEAQNCSILRNPVLLVTNDSVDIDKVNDIPVEATEPAILLGVIVNKVNHDSQVSVERPDDTSPKEFQQTTKAIKYNDPVQNVVKKFDIIEKASIFVQPVAEMAMLMQAPPSPIPTSNSVIIDNDKGSEFPPFQSVVPAVGGNSRLRPRTSRLPIVQMETQLTIDEEEALHCFDDVLFEFENDLPESQISKDLCSC